MVSRGDALSRWCERVADDEKVARLEAAGYPRLLARLLAVRGITTETVADYLDPSLSRLAKPTELPGVAAAAETILAAVSAHKRIVVFGDYDCDGVCATAILVLALRALKADVVPFIPKRLTEGYGMTEASVLRMRRENPSVGLVVTVDNGINSIDWVAALQSEGIDVIVTDHHLPGPELPDCTIANPKVAAPSELEGLCGAGVAFLLSNLLICRAQEKGCYQGPKIGGPLLVLAGLATVTDVMPLVAQNRILVSEALRRFRQIAPIGLRELLDRASRTASLQLKVEDFGFLIGPRINAAGRMASGDDALQLILSSDRERAREFAQRVDLCNVERKGVEQKMFEKAMAQVIPGAAAQVIDLPDGHPGVAGIVAARVLERVGAGPVCVVVEGHGSARAPVGFNVRDALEAASAALTRFGGHAAAGGFSVKEGEIDSFRSLFTAACAAQIAAMPSGICGSIPFDAWIRGEDVTLDFAEKLMKMAPFGEGNERPAFAMRGVRFSDVRPLGQEGKHLSISICPCSTGTGAKIAIAESLRAIWWNRGNLVEKLRAATSSHDILFTLEISDYLYRHVELRLLAIDDD